MPNTRNSDRRVQKTQSHLHEALVSLIHEKPYDEIVVKEILARANVGRSTFYTHFRDKDELLDSGIRSMLSANEMTSPISPDFANRMLRFSLPMFEHIEHYRSSADTSVDAKGRAVVHEHLRRLLVELIDDDLRHLGRRQKASRHRMPSDLLAQHVASTFLLVLTWWLESPNALSSREVNELYRALILPMAAEILDT